jgi:hypothetical protein
LGAWFPAGGAILEGSGNFRRWGLAGGSRFLEVGPWEYLSLISISLSLLPVCHEVNSAPLPYTPAAIIFWPSSHLLKPLKMLAKISLPPLNCFCQVFGHSDNKSNCFFLKIYFWLRMFCREFTLLNPWFASVLDYK